MTRDLLLQILKKNRYLLIFITAFLIRAIFILQWGNFPYEANFFSDAWVHNVWARDIANGALLRHTAFYQSYLYPYIIAFFFKIFGFRFFIIYLLQALLDSLSCVLITRISEKLFGGVAAAAAAVIGVFYAPLIFSTALLTKETVTVFSCAVFLRFLLLYSENGRLKDCLAWSAALGFAVVCRPNMAVVFPFALFWLAASSGIRIMSKRFLSLLLTAAAGLMIFILPGTAHNLIVSKDFVPLNYAGGFVYFLGNNQDADGALTYPPGLSSDPLVEEKQITAMAEYNLGEKLSPSGVSSFWFRQGLRYNLHHPFNSLLLAVKKFYLFWNSFELPDNYDIDFVRKNLHTVLGFPLAGFTLAGCLGVIGLFLIRPGEKGSVLPLLFWPYMLSLLPFVITGRYRLPALVFLIPSAAGAVEYFLRLDYRHMHRFEFRHTARALVYALPFIIICVMPTPVNKTLKDSESWGRLAALYASDGDYENTIRTFEKAEETDPRGVTSEAVSAEADALLDRGDFKKAEDTFEYWLKFTGGNGELHKYYGIMLNKEGYYERSAEHLIKSAETDPYPETQYKYLADCYTRLSDTRRYCIAVKELYRIAPSNGLKKEISANCA